MANPSSSFLAAEPAHSAAREMLAMLFMFAMTALVVVGVPASSWRDPLYEPCHAATVGALALVLFLTVTRWLGGRALASERLAIAGFLVSMPVIYIARWYWTRTMTPVDTSWLWIEILGLTVYAACAVLGYRNSPKLLAAGIAAHGVIWDSGHLFQHTFMPQWYARGCLVFDIGVALYVLARASRWQQRSASAR